MKIYVDGSGWNGKSCAYAILIKGTNTPFVIEYKTKMTCNEMEYLAVLEGCKVANEGDIILTDSQLISNQVYGRWKINKERLKVFVGKIRELMQEKRLSVDWISREKNLAGKLLEKR